MGEAAAEADYIANQSGISKPFATENLKAVSAAIRSIGEDLADTPAGAEKLIRTFRAASTQIDSAIRDGVITPLERAQLSTDVLGRLFVQSLPRRFFTGLGANVRSGIEDATAQAKVAVADMGAEVRSGIEDAARGAAAAAADMGADIGRNLRAGILRSIKAQQGQLAGLDEQFNQIISAGGSPEQQIANLRRQAARFQEIIAQAGPNAAGVALEARRKARSDLARTNDQIRSLEEQIANDKQQAADEAIRIRNEADQKFLDTLGLGRRPAEQRLARARATDTARDDIPALLAYRQRIQSEIRQVSTGVRDAKARTQQLDRLADELFQNSLDLQAARDKRDDAIQASVEERRTALRSIAETTGNTALLIRVLDQEIADARQVLAKARAAKQGQEVARAALLELQEERRDTLNEARSGLLESAFRLAEARGNESQMLQILDLRIKQARLEVRQARTLAERLAEQADVQELINQRNEILKEKVEEGQRGTTAFDLLQQFADRFRQSAGGLIGTDQPFAGPTGFTADISQFLRRQPGGVVPPGATAAKTQQAQASKQTTELIAALKALTDATLGASGGNSSTAGLPDRAVRAMGLRYQAMAKFYESRSEKAAVEARSGI